MLIVIYIALIPVFTVAFAIEIYFCVKSVMSKARLYKKLKTICNENKFALQFNRKFIASFFKFSTIPDITIKRHRKTYHIRLMPCENKRLYYVFPSGEYYVAFARIEWTFNPTGSFKHIPPFDQKYQTENESSEIENVLLFFSVMPNISVLDDNHTQRTVLEKTRQIFGWSVYTPTSFIDELNRIILSQKSEEPKC